MSADFKSLMSLPTASWKSAGSDASAIVVIGIVIESVGLTKLALSWPKRGSFGGAFELRECAARVALPLEFEDFGGLDEGQPERSPDIGHAFHEMRDMRIRVQGTWRDAQSLAASGDRRIIDWLDIDRVAIEQHVGRALAEFGIADAHWHDMGRVRRHREAGRAQSMFGEHRLALMLRAEFIALSLLQEAYGGCRGGGERWRQSRGENEGGRERAYGEEDRRF